MHNSTPQRHTSATPAHIKLHTTGAQHRIGTCTYRVYLREGPNRLFTAAARLRLSSIVCAWSYNE